MMDLDREIRAFLEEEARSAPPPVEPEPVVRRARRRQVATVAIGLVATTAAVIASIAAGTALMRTAERRVPTEPPDAFSAGPLEAVTAQPVSFEGLVVDTDGNLWSTTPALTRFDPRSGSIRTFTIVDHPAFEAVTDVAPAGVGGVWVLSARPSERPVVRRFGGEDVLVDTSPAETSAPAPAYLSEIVEAPDGTIWASGHGVFSWSGGPWVEAPSEGRPTSESGAIAVDADGNAWVANLDYPGPTWAGVSRFDGRSWTTYGGQDLDPSGTSGADAGAIWTIVAGPDGDVWIGGNGVVARFADGAWTSFDSRELGLGNVMSIAVADGAVWIGGEAIGGPAIARFDGSTWVPVVEGLEGDGGTEYTRVAATPEGIWATTNIGLWRLRGSRWQLALAEGPSDVMPPMAGAAVDEVWTGDWTALGGVWHLEGGRWTHHDLSEVGAGGGVSALLVADDGTVWAATHRGLARFDGVRWQEVETGPRTALALAPNGEVWAASRGGPDGATVAPVGGPELPGLAPVVGDVGSLAIGPTGEVWAGSFGVWGMGGGLARFDGERWTRMEPVAGAEDLLVQDVAMTPDGDVWVTAAVPSDGAAQPPTSVLARYRDGTWATLGEADGVPSSDAGFPRELEVTRDGRLLLASAAGLFELRDGAWTRVEVGAFFNETVRWAHTFSIAPDGTIWLAGDGLFRLAPR